MREYINNFINYFLDKIIYPIFYFCETEPIKAMPVSQSKPRSN
jgi:hypothetical protein